MICKVCNIFMKSGIRYEQTNKRGISRRFNECPKCHFRKYDDRSNFLVESITKLNGIK